MFTCAICGNSYDDSLLNEHHRIPRAFGGDDSKENLRFLCPNCHRQTETWGFKGKKKYFN